MRSKFTALNEAAKVVASSKVTKTLFSLSETDKELQALVVQRKEFEERRATLLSDLAVAKEKS
jgi:hypothetical protein